MKMQFEFDLFGDGKNYFHVHGHGSFIFSYEEVVLDPSVLFYLTNIKVKETDITFYIPDHLHRLIQQARNNKKYRKFLAGFLSYFKYPRSKPIDSDSWEIFYQNIDKMKIENISIEDIRKENENDYYRNYLKLFSDHDFYISLSKPVNLLGDTLAKIMEFSKHSGNIILSKSRRISRLLHEKITTLELPKYFSYVIEAKKLMIRKIFYARRTGKFYLGVSLGIGGFVHPAVGGVGVLYAHFEP